MDIRLLTTVPDLRLYEEWIAHHADATLWQSLDWKKYQEALGRKTKLYGAFEDGKIVASALVIVDRTAGDLSTWDMPRGPLGVERGQTATDRGQWTEDSSMKMSTALLLNHLVSEAKKDRCLCIYISPTLPLASLSTVHFPLSTSPRHEQPEATRIVDLTQTEEQILAQMHQKGRYNIRVAEKNGVRVEESADTASFAKLMADTSARDGFRAPTRKQFDAFLQSIPKSFLLLAYAPDTKEPIAGVVGAVWKTCGIYYYGASSYDHRSLMAPYALQWEAMKRCKKAGCARYDLLGVSPPSAPPDHAWQGISSFKEKFGGTVITYPQEQRIVLKPVALSLLEMKRKVLG